MERDDDWDVRFLSIRKQAEAKAPFNIPFPDLSTFQPSQRPFGPKEFETKVLDISLFSGFDSTRINTQDLGPFQADTPFPSQGSYELTVTSLGRSSFSDITSTSSSSSYEHLSASVGVAVDCVVFGGSVSVSYDKYVSTNADQGEVAFHKRFGDYFIGGFVTGAEAGLLMSYAHSARQETEITRFTITVKVLFWSASHTEETVHTDTIDTSQLNFVSFNTLEPSSPLLNLQSGPGSIGIASQNQTLEATQARVQEMTIAVQSMSTLVVAKRPSFFGTDLGTQAWDDGGALTVDYAATRLIRLHPSGILLQLQLVPYATLKEYQEVLGSKA